MKKQSVFCISFFLIMALSVTGQPQLAYQSYNTQGENLIHIATADFDGVGARDTKQPNVILILVDDLGWTDLACYGSDFYQTPNIDQLACEGVQFSNSYSSCTVCSPTRSSIMTGKYPARLHLTDWIEGHKYPWARMNVPDWKMYLDTAEYTLAEAFKSAGYFTAHVGKWHLGEHW